MPYTIGTAGHIDHGKTTLVRALTGIDTDRLKAEKEQGISIELGFAPLQLSDGSVVGIVDVPGHERFIRQMVAGAQAIDLVLLVIAADDGVMPQTREHLEILKLLGIEKALITITKYDLVTKSQLDRCRQAIDDLLQGTAFHNSPRLVVSSATQDGVEELRRRIEMSLPTCGNTRQEDFFRLPVDRVFHLRGHGTIVTGTAISGDVSASKPLQITSSGEQVRLRSIEVHGEKVSQGVAGQRIALNLATKGRVPIVRGDIICSPEVSIVNERIDVSLEVLAGAPSLLKSHQRVRFHIGTTERLAKVILLDGESALEPGQQSFAQIVFSQPIHALRHDRFIIRNENASRTIGGGEVVLTQAPRHRQSEGALHPRLRSLHQASSENEIVEALLTIRGPVIETGHLAKELHRVTDEIVSETINDHCLLHLPNSSDPKFITTREHFTNSREQIISMLARFHQEQPNQPGIDATLRNKSSPLNKEGLRGVAPTTASPHPAIIDKLIHDGDIIRDGNLLRLPTHSATLSVKDRALADRAQALIIAGGFTPPDLNKIGDELGLKEKVFNDLLHQLEREEQIVLISDTMAYSASVLDKVRDLIREHILAKGEVSARELRDLIDASRKYSIALLDYFDRSGFTMRVGDVRKLRP